ncbi:MAG TPA: glycosyltransferase family 4 protein [Fimbriimonadaceae bacterium]|nr:glycosyltransferase family 4 protein [Fimbriimonadaceae bacterium]
MNDRPLKAFQFIEGGARYGAAVSIMNIAEGMRQSDVDVQFGVFAGRPLGQVLRERGFIVHEIPAEHRFDLRGIRALVRLFRQERFDVVHTHLSRATVNGTIAARLTKTPIVATVHGMNRKYTYMLANHIMTVSEAAKQHLVKQGISESKITPVYNCIRLEPFSGRPDPVAVRRTFGISPGAVVAGTVSRAHSQKGIDVAIDAVAELRRRGFEAEYLFVGDGPHLEEFKAQASRLGIQNHVHFPGFADDITGALATMDVFMFPTHREAFGISLLEAMAVGVPIVASAVDGVPEVLEGNSGLLLEHRTALAFADAAQRLIEDPSLRMTIACNARSRVETVFSVERTARSVEHVYRLAMRQAEIGSRRPYRDVL